MKNVNQVLLMLMAVTVFFMTSCKKDPVDNIEPIDPIEVVPVETSDNTLMEDAAKTTSTGIELECITILYPFDVITVDGNIITVNDSTDFNTAISDPIDYVLDFVYPLNAEDEDGNAITINNMDELVDAFISCVPTAGWDSLESGGFPAFNPANLCVDLVYPVTLVDDSGTLILVNDGSEFADAIALNPLIYFEFPLTVVDEDGIIFTVNDEVEFMDALTECVTIDLTIVNSIYIVGVEGCFDLMYPLDVILPDSSIQTVDNANELGTAILAGAIDFSYPMDVLLEDGTTVTVNEEYDLLFITSDCLGIIDGGQITLAIPDYDLLVGLANDCFDVNYPITIDVTDGSGVATSVTLNNDAEVENFNTAYLGFTDAILGYPFDVTLISDGSIVTINDFGGLLDVAFDCF